MAAQLGGSKAKETGGSKAKETGGSKAKETELDVDLFTSGTERTFGFDF